jgi:hypothetical protein
MFIDLNCGSIGVGSDSAILILQHLTRDRKAVLSVFAQSQKTIVF